MATRWENLTSSERIWYEKTPFGHPCSTCGLMLETEADFAKHFILWPGYQNNGDCPKSKRKR